MSTKEECILDGVLDSLEDIGYTGHLLEDGALQAAADAGLCSPHYVTIVTALCFQLKALLTMQEAVTTPTGAEDRDSFLLEMRAFLMELGCPHPSLTEAPGCLASYTTRLLLIDYLLSELLAARLMRVRKADKDVATFPDQSSPYSVPGNLQTMLNVYGISQPPSHIAVHQIFDQIIAKTQECVLAGPIEPGLVTQALTAEQWATLDRINDSLTKEYTVRRQMLLTRCDVTVQSFRWSDKTKGKGDEFDKAYQSMRAKLAPSAPVSIARVLAAKKDLLVVHRTSSGEAREATQCAINKVLIGKVPDRGGRPRETRPRPDMPSFKKRSEPPPQERRDGGYGGGRRGGRGGRVQGGWSGGHGKGGHGGYHQQRGGFHGKQQYGGGGHQQHYYS